jgi:hypothetical protein
MLVAVLALGPSSCNSERDCSDTSGACGPDISVALSTPAEVNQIAASGACRYCDFHITQPSCSIETSGECVVTVTTRDGRRGTGTVLIEDLVEDPCCGLRDARGTVYVTVELQDAGEGGAGGGP